MSTRKPLGVYYNDDNSPCWAFADRAALSRALGLTAYQLRNGMEADGSYTISPGFVARVLEPSVYRNDIRNRLGNTSDSDAIELMRNSQKPTLLPEARRECAKCQRELVVNTDNFQYNSARSYFHPVCRECHNDVNKANHAKKRALREEAGSFTCDLCKGSCARRERADAEMSICKTCKQKQVDQMLPTDRKAVGVFCRTEAGWNPNPIWTFPTAYAFYHPAGVGQNGFESALRRGFWSPAKDSPHQLRYISREIFESTHIIKNRASDVLNAIQSGSMLQDTISDQPTVSPCSQCQRELPRTSEYYSREGSSLRTTCRSCRSAADALRKSRASEAYKEMGWFFCNDCNDVHYSDEVERSSDRDGCKLSYNRNRVAITKERALATDPSMVDGHPCHEPHCKKPFKPEDFKWKQTRWSSSCRECFNSKKYWAVWREKKRTQDLVEYLRYYALQQFDFRRRNPEVLEAYNRDRRTDPNRRLRVIKESAAKRGIAFHTEDEAEMLRILREPCMYCESTPATGAGLNGLDRIDAGGAYSINNVVASCPLDNMLKCDSTPEDYIRRMCLIHTIGKKNGVVIDFDVVPRTNFSGANSPAVWGRKEGVESSGEGAVGQCYLCERRGKLGIDRVDSNESYVDEDNRRPCCWPCNKIKRDLSLPALYLHASRVYAVHQNEYTETAIVPTTRPEAAPRAPVEPSSSSHAPRLAHVMNFIITDENDVTVAAYKTKKELAAALQITPPNLNSRLEREGTGDTCVLEGGWIIKRIQTEPLKPIEHSEAFAIYLSSLEPLAAPKPRAKRKLRTNEWILILDENDANTTLAKYSSIKALADALGLSGHAAISRQLEKGKLLDRWPVRYGEEEPCTLQDEFPEMYTGKRICVYDNNTLVATARTEAALAKIISEADPANQGDAVLFRKIVDKHRHAIGRALRKNGELHGKNGRVYTLARVSGDSLDEEDTGNDFATQFNSSSA